MNKCYKIKNTRRLVLSFIMCLSICSCFAMTAYAIETPNVISRLGSNMSVAYSDTTAGTHKLFGGNNSSSSKRAVYFEAQRSSGEKFVKDTQRKVDIGKPIDNVLTTFTGSTQLWRLELNPYGIATKGCTAIGYMWYKM